MMPFGWLRTKGMDDVKSREIVDVLPVGTKVSLDYSGSTIESSIISIAIEGDESSVLYQVKIDDPTNVYAVYATRDELSVLSRPATRLTLTIETPKGE